jgi:hypothetical protein
MSSVVRMVAAAALFSSWGIASAASADEVVLSDQKVVLCPSGDTLIHADAKPNAALDIVRIGPDNLTTLGVGGPTYPSATLGKDAQGFRLKEPPRQPVTVKYECREHRVGA